MSKRRSFLSAGVKHATVGAIWGADQSVAAVGPNRGERFTERPRTARDFGAVGDGVADDTDAIRRAINACVDLIIPPGLYLLTQYIEIPSGRIVRILGTLNCRDKSAGLFARSASNIVVDGEGVGLITDDWVAKRYIWNQHQGTGPDRRYAPVVHFIGCTNCHVQNINFRYISVGITFSSFTQVSYVDVLEMKLEGAGCKRCTASKNSAEFIEGAAIAGLACTNLVFTENYVYRSGDGGIYMMGCSQSDILSNVRASPYGEQNDDQGIEAENADGGRIAGNKVIGIRSFGIDIKNGCRRLIVEDNEIVDCGRAAIVVRMGEGGRNPSFEILIRNNSIKNSGFDHGQDRSAVSAAIWIDAALQVEVSGNAIRGYRIGNAIRMATTLEALGVLNSESGLQTHAIVENNSITWKDSAQFDDRTFSQSEVDAPALLVNGVYDIVSITGNKILGYEYGVAGGIVSKNASAIELQFWKSVWRRRGGEVQRIWPISANISQNVIAKVRGNGIVVRSAEVSSGDGVSIFGNFVAGCEGYGLLVEGVTSSSVDMNRFVDCGALLGGAALQLTNSPGTTTTGNRVARVLGKDQDRVGPSGSVPQ